MNTQKVELKWPEIFSLAGLNAAVVISWIAYHEYQPVLLEKFQFNDLAEFLVIAKAIILIVIPPLAGWLADRMLERYGKFFTIFTVGIGATAMIFMIVASIIGAGPLSTLRTFLPVMIVFWLISMNLFISPANSMIESFAPAQKLPLVMGVLVLVTELLYAMEPIVVLLVNFFGDTLTFIVGAVLIGGTGFIFHKVSSDEVMTRREEQIKEKSNNRSFNSSSFLVIVIVGLSLGLGKALLTEFFPDYLAQRFPEFEDIAAFVAFGLLGFSAILAFVISRYISEMDLTNVIISGMVFLLFGAIIMVVSNSFLLSVVAGAIIAASFSVMNISSLPFALKNLSIRHVTYGVGILIGASEVFSGLFEYYL